MRRVRRFVEGQTAPLRVTLYDGEGRSRVAIDGTGLTVSLMLRDRNESLVPVAGKVSWANQGSGYAQFDPEPTDLRAINSPYTARWIVTDSTGKWAPYPDHDTEPEEWRVGK